MPSVAKVAHASRVGRVKRDPAFRTTTWDLIPQRLHATSATEMTGVHIARKRSVGVNRLGWVGFATCHGCAPAFEIGVLTWDRATWDSHNLIVPNSCYSRLTQSMNANAWSSTGC
jgi:hypothetical protein